MMHPMTLHHFVAKSQKAIDIDAGYVAQETLIIGLFCGNWPIKLRHPMTAYQWLKTIAKSVSQKTIAKDAS